MFGRMEKRDVWSARVREWRTSGKSLSEFCRGREFSAQGLGYWVKRVEASEPSAPGTKSVRLARVVRTRDGAPVEQTSPVTGLRSAATQCLVIEAGALRLHVPESVECTRLEAVLIAVGRATKAGGA